MTTHRYPTQLPPDRVQTIEDSAALTQAHVAAAAWQQQSEQHEATLVELRKQLDDTAHMLSIVRAERDRYGAGIFRAAADYAALEDELAAERARADVAERHAAELGMALAAVEEGA